MALPIITGCLFPRLEKLRLARNENPPHALSGKLQHISKKRSIKSGTYYKVTICRNCSDSNEHVDLGCFSDLESAILTNDVYEILSHRSIHVHQLTDEDMKFANELTVSRSWRNQVVEVNLMQLMKENISRLEINPYTLPISASNHISSSASSGNSGKSKLSHHKGKKHGPSAVHRRIMTKRFLQLMDLNAHFIKALCCVPQAACDINPVLVAMAKLSVEPSTHPSPSSLSSQASSGEAASSPVLTPTSKFYNVKNLEAILTSAIACGVISTSLIHLLSASCLEGEGGHAIIHSDDSSGTSGLHEGVEGGRSGLTGFIQDSLGAEIILSFSDISLMKTSMIEAIEGRQHIAVWGDMMQQLLR